jgi:glycosyltransferase involved in cell wall biosynthesis
VTLCVVVEHRFDRTPDGAVWTGSSHSYADSARYLDVFDHIRIFARVRDVDRVSPTAIRADGQGVSFAALPYYVGLGQFCLRSRSVRQAALDAIGPTDAILLKAPSPLACLIEPALHKQGRPFALQVIGDPWGTYAKGSANDILRPVVRLIFTAMSAAQARHAAAVSYVTSLALQSRYPASPSAYQIAVSDVNLSPDAFADAPRRIPSPPSLISLIAIGAMEQPYKGLDVLIHALAVIRSRGLDFRLMLVGDGRLRPELVSLAARLGIDSAVSFTGSLPSGRTIIEALDASDLFVMPSRTEGLPRAIVEAMARALPCIGSHVGGIPELLEPEDLVEPGDPAALAAKIIEVAGSPERMERMSQRNLMRAQDFQEHLLSARRREFFSRVHDITALWSSDWKNATREGRRFLH